MTSLHEEIIVKTAAGDLHGKLFVDHHGLPALRIVHIGATDEYYFPSTFPAAWSICQQPHTTGGPLLEAWWNIERIREEIIEAQLEAEAEDRDHAQQREIDNRLAMEIKEGEE